MMPTYISTLQTDWFFAAMLFFTGIYCVFVSRNLIRTLIGTLLMLNSAILGIIASGQALGNINLAQELACAALAVQLASAIIGAALIIRNFRFTGSTDVKRLNKLKG